MPHTRARALAFAVGAALAILVTGAYLPAVRGEFQFDDTRFVVTRATVTLQPYLDPATWTGGFAGSGRPVTQLTYALNWVTTGANPLPYHLVNVALHLVAVALVFGFTRITLRRLGLPHAGVVSAVAAVAFSVHPLQTQAVSYISQRGEVLASVLYLGALLLLVASDDMERPGRRWTFRVLALVLFVLALGAKQIACTLPAAWLLHVAFFPAGAEHGVSPARRVGRRLIMLLPLFAIAALVVIAGGRAARGLTDAGFGMEWLGASKYLLTQFRVLPVYLGLLAWPSGQSVDWDFPPSQGLTDPLTTAAGLLLLAGLVAASVAVERRTRTRGEPGAACARLAAFGILWFLLVLSPTSSVFPIADVLVEHRVYLACWGPLAAAAAVLVVTVQPRWGWSATGALTAAAALALAAATWQRNSVWQSEIALWTDAAAKAPGKGRVHANLGYALARAGRDAEALEHYQRALRLGDRSIQLETVLRNTAASLAAVGRAADAATLLEPAVNGGTAEPLTVHLLARAYLAAGRRAEGEHLLREILARHPGLATAYNTLGEVLFEQGNPSGAREAFATAARLAPWDAQALLNLAEVEYGLGHLPEACSALRAVRWAPFGFGGSTALAEKLLAELRCPE